MPHELLAAALDQAERADASVRAAALLNIARVTAVFDQSAAVRVLERGIAEATALPDADRPAILARAVALAACVSPSHAFRLVPLLADEHRAIYLQTALSDMLSHGRAAEAVAYLIEPLPGEEYPFDAASMAMGRCPDDDTRRQILRTALRAMREPIRSRYRGPFGPHSALRLFSSQARLLPAPEATEAVREIVRRILADPDQRVNYGSGTASFSVRFSSSHDSQLFGVLGSLNRLDPDLARSLFPNHRELAKAAARFPYGPESIDAEIQAETQQMARRDVTPDEQVEPPDFIHVGDDVLPVAEAIRTEFAEAFTSILTLYHADVGENPNLAPRECWPSMFALRQVFHKAGEHEGRAAARYLDRVPDAGLRLLASIELSAALAGLPQIGGMVIPPKPRRRTGVGAPPFRPDGADELLSEIAALHKKTLTREQLPPARRPPLSPSRDVRISPTTRSAADGPAGGCGSDFWTIEGAPLKPLLSKLYGVLETRIELPTALDATRYDFHLVLAHDESQEMMSRLMQEGIAAHFGVSITHEDRSQDVYILTAPNGVRAIKAPDEFRGGLGGISTGSISWSVRSTGPDVNEGAQDLDLEQIMDMSMAASEHSTGPAEERQRVFDAMLRATRGRPNDRVLTGISQSMTMAQLCALLESGLDRPIVDETGATGVYRFDIETEAETTLAFLHGLEKELGLVAISGRRNVSMLVVRQK